MIAALVACCSKAAAQDAPQQLSVPGPPAADAADETNRVVVSGSLRCIAKYQDPKTFWECVILELGEKPSEPRNAYAVALWGPVGVKNPTPDLLIFGRITGLSSIDDFESAQFSMREGGFRESFSASKLFYREFKIGERCERYVLRKIWSWEDMKDGSGTPPPPTFFDLSVPPSQLVKGTKIGFFLPGMKTGCD